MDIKNLVDEMNLNQQEAFLNELMVRGRIAVHLASRDETVPVDDVYDNSSIPNGANVETAKHGILTILYIDHKLAKEG